MGVQWSIRRSWQSSAQARFGFVGAALVGGSLLMNSACGSPPAPPAAATTAPAPPSSADVLSRLTDGIGSGAITVVDLTSTLNEKTPVISLPPPFANTPGYSHKEISHYDAKGPAWYWNAITVGEHVGTHFDAPCHWISGRDKPCVDQIDGKQFVGPAVVIDVTSDVAKSADYALSKDAVLAWEQAHGRIPARAWVVLHTGWASRATDTAAFFNVGADKAPHYPGFGKDAAELLTRERDILGVATEAVGTDAAVGAKGNPPFPNHFTMHGAGKFGLTQLTNVDKLPATGAVIVATPLKLEHGSGSPVRVIALVPAS
jgi:kynurenine formamidase